jgi:hypothetical protein
MTKTSGPAFNKNFKNVLTTFTKISNNTPTALSYTGFRERHELCVNFSIFGKK